MKLPLATVKDSDARIHSSVNI